MDSTQGRASQRRWRWGHSPFAAAVAFCPGCEMARSDLLTDTLILIGDADDWTPVSRCERWRDTVASHGHMVQLIAYHGAAHGFDTERPSHAYAGHIVGGDAAAADDAITQTQALFQRASRAGAWRLFADLTGLRIWSISLQSKKLLSL